ncbi:MAG: hypothetical protein ACREDR_48795 [Blastocatellia bacterium]
MTKKGTAAYPEGRAFADRERALEDEYFHRKEQELIEKLHRRARLDAERKKMAEALGFANLEILDHLQEMGYRSDTIALLFLVPLVQVAWAEGVVTKRERELVLKVAASRGIQESSPAYRQLVGWLDQRPSEEFFEDTLRVISALLAEEPAARSQNDQRDLVSYCTQIAKVSGGILGIGAISSDERTVIEHIVRELAYGAEYESGE